MNERDPLGEVVIGPNDLNTDVIMKIKTVRYCRHPHIYTNVSLQPPIYYNNIIPRNWSPRFKAGPSGSAKVPWMAHEEPFQSPKRSFHCVQSSSLRRTMSLWSNSPLARSLLHNNNNNNNHRHQLLLLQVTQPYHLRLLQATATELHLPRAITAQQPRLATK